MMQPPLEQLTANLDSKYTLVVAAAKRARRLLDEGAEDEPGRPKPVTQALREIALGQLTYERLKTGVK
ncbi:MAG: DNA-directed RNA polymerase subunit omega [Thermaerobacter sp.]|nr:DNA-directed RNA polymerase subunit omega [Thermaerobacter sp.]